MMLRKLIKKFLSNNGYEIYHKDFYDFNDLDTLGCFFKDNEAITIIDAGANVGQTVARFKRRWPNSIVHSFEPDPDVFQNLKENTQNLVDVYLNNLGLGDEESVREFYKMQDSGSSSFIPIDKSSRTYQVLHKRENFRHHNKSSLKSVQDSKIKCSITTLDSYCNKNDIDRINLLKMDVQGYEPHILSGAVNLLKDNNIDVILTEIMFTDYYAKIGSFFDIESIIRKYGYVLYDLPYIARVPNDNMRRLFFVDAIYARESLINSST